MRQIPLSQGKLALVDDEDYEWLSQWKWFAGARRRTFYALRNLRRDDGQVTTQLMHRLVMSHPEGLQVDHSDHNGLNNQRSNLRICNNHEQHGNQQPQKRETSSRFKGVSRHMQTRKWVARIKVHGKSRHLGLFTNEEAAARAYDEAAREQFGAYAYLNFPNEGENGWQMNDATVITPARTVSA